MKLAVHMHVQQGQTQPRVYGETAGVTTNALENKLKCVTGILDDYKALDISVISLAGKADFADYLVVATGTSSRHVSSMGSALKSRMGKEALSIEGTERGEWVCADIGDIVVHVFLAEKRALYNLEKLWSHTFTEMPTDLAS